MSSIHWAKVDKKKGLEKHSWILQIHLGMVHRWWFDHL